MLPQFMNLPFVWELLQKVFFGRQNHRNRRFKFLRFWSCTDMRLCWAIVPGDTFSRLKSPTIQHWPQKFLLPWVGFPKHDPPNGHCTIPSTLLVSFFTQVANLSRHAHVRQLELNTAFWASRFGQWGHGLTTDGSETTDGKPFVPS